MANLALKMIDECIERNSYEISDYETEFIIDNDNKAEWALKKISEEKAEMQRYVNICQTMINEYQTKIQQVQEQFKNKTSYLKNQLALYFETIEPKKTKTQESYKLPSGILKKKYPGPEFVRDEEKLIEWLKNSNMNDLIKTKELADWATLKKSIKVSGDKAITEDGEVIEGIEVQERSPVFEIEI